MNDKGHFLSFLLFRRSLIVWTTCWALQPWITTARFVMNFGALWTKKSGYKIATSIPTLRIWHRIPLSKMVACGLSTISSTIEKWNAWFSLPAALKVPSAADNLGTIAPMRRMRWYLKIKILFVFFFQNYIPKFFLEVPPDWPSLSLSLCNRKLTWQFF